MKDTKSPRRMSPSEAKDRIKILQALKDFLDSSAENMSLLSANEVLQVIHEMLFFAQQFFLQEKIYLTDQPYPEIEVGETATDPKNQETYGTVVSRVHKFYQTPVRLPWTAGYFGILLEEVTILGRQILRVKKDPRWVREYVSDLPVDFTGKPGGNLIISPKVSEVKKAPTSEVSQLVTPLKKIIMAQQREINNLQAILRKTRRISTKSK